MSGIAEILWVKSEHEVVLFMKGQTNGTTEQTSQYQSSLMVLMTWWKVCLAAADGSLVVPSFGSRMEGKVIAIGLDGT